MTVHEMPRPVTEAVEAAHAAMAGLQEPYDLGVAWVSFSWEQPDELDPSCVILRVRVPTVGVAVLVRCVGSPPRCEVIVDEAGGHVWSLRCERQANLRFTAFEEPLAKTFDTLDLDWLCLQAAGCVAAMQFEMFRAVSPHAAQVLLRPLASSGGGVEAALAEFDRFVRRSAA